MYDSYQYDSLEHFGIKGMKWGVRRTPEQLGHRRERTPEQIARAQKRKEVAVAVAKTGVKIAARTAATVAVGSLGGMVLREAINSPAGKAAIAAGSKVIGDAMPDFAKTSADKVVSTLSKALNVQDRSTGWQSTFTPKSDANWTPVSPSRRAQQLTRDIRAVREMPYTGWQQIPAPKSDANWKPSTPSRRVQDLNDQIQLAARLAENKKKLGLIVNTKRE